MVVLPRLSVTSCIFEAIIPEVHRGQCGASDPECIIGRNWGARESPMSLVPPTWGHWKTATPRIQAMIQGGGRVCRSMRHRGADCRRAPAARRGRDSRGDPRITTRSASQSVFPNRSSTCQSMRRPCISGTSSRMSRPCATTGTKDQNLTFQLGFDKLTDPTGQEFEVQQGAGAAAMLIDGGKARDHSSKLSGTNGGGREDHSTGALFRAHSEAECAANRERNCRGDQGHSTGAHFQSAQWTRRTICPCRKSWKNP